MCGLTDGVFSPSVSFARSSAIHSSAFASIVSDTAFGSRGGGLSAEKLELGFSWSIRIYQDLAGVLRQRIA